ncbi:hypothetical protein THAOC_04231, partial [Thalassiosira oceanica]
RPQGPQGEGAALVELPRPPIDADLQCGVGILRVVGHVDERYQKALNLLDLVLIRHLAEQAFVLAVRIADHVPCREAAGAHHPRGPLQVLDGNPIDRRDIFDDVLAAQDSGRVVRYLDLLDRAPRPVVGGETLRPRDVVRPRREGRNVRGILAVLREGAQELEALVDVLHVLVVPPVAPGDRREVVAHRPAESVADQQGRAVRYLDEQLAPPRVGPRVKTPESVPRVHLDLHARPPAARFVLGALDPLHELLGPVRGPPERLVEKRDEVQHGRERRQAGHPHEVGGGRRPPRDPYQRKDNGHLERTRGMEQKQLQHDCASSLRDHS